MSAYYLDGQVPSQIGEFTVSLPSATDGAKVLVTPDGFVSRLELLHIRLHFNGLNGERDFYPQILDPNNRVLINIIGGTESYGGAANPPPDNVDYTYWRGAGTPTFSNTLIDPNTQFVAVIVLPDVWLPSGMTLVTHTVGFQAGDSIVSINGIMDLREDIGRAGFDPNLGNGALRGANALDYLLHVPGS